MTKDLPQKIQEWSCWYISIASKTLGKVLTSTVHHPESCAQWPQSSFLRRAFSVHCSQSSFKRPQRTHEFSVISPVSRVQSPASRVQHPESSVQRLESRVQPPTLVSRVQELRYVAIMSLSGKKQTT